MLLLAMSSRLISVISTPDVKALADKALLHQISESDINGKPSL